MKNPHNVKNLLAYAIPEMLSFFQATTKAPTAGFANNGRTAADSPHLLTLNNTGAAGVIRVVRSQQRHGSDRIRTETPAGLTLTIE